MEDDPSILLIDIEKLKDLINKNLEEDPNWLPDDEEELVNKKKRTLMDINIKSKKSVNNLDGLIDVLESNIHKRISKRKKTSDQKEENNLILNNIISSLKELRDMVGLEKVKQQIVNQILLFVQNLNDKGMFLHTVLTGNPGVGKTNLCRILAKIYKNLGFLETEKIVFADRSQLIGQYLGETAIKTKNVLDSAKGGILLIDEAYSLGNSGDGDSFSKECIDTINQYLSEHVDEFVCIIAGYKKDIEECFFSRNRGLERRFPWRYDLDNYSCGELYRILLKQMQQDEWTSQVEQDFVVSLLESNRDIFQNNGGDTQIFLDKCKIVHAQRIFGTKQNKKSLIKDDFIKGFNVFKDLKKKKNKDDGSKYLTSLYI